MSELVIGDVYRSTDNKRAMIEMNKNFHGDTFTGGSDNETSKKPTKTKDTEQLPVTLEAAEAAASHDHVSAAPQVLESTQVQCKCGGTTNCEHCKTQLPESTPSLHENDQKSKANVAQKATSSFSSDKQQLSIAKACIVHSESLHNSGYYSRPLPMDTCVVIKDVEVVPGLYIRRFEPHNPTYISRYKLLVMYIATWS